LTDLDSLSCSLEAFAGLIADILKRGKSVRFRAHGESMQPLLRNGDYLLVQPVEAKRLRIGDVVLSNSQMEHIVAHRVIGRQLDRKGYAFLLKGDQAAQPDGWIPQDQVYGRVTEIERAGVRIEMGRLVMRVLGWLAVLRSRGHRAGAPSFRAVWRLVKRLPIFEIYLS
jgi:signal peptidase I